MLPDKSDLPSGAFLLGSTGGKITEGWDSSQEWTQVTMIAEADVQLHSSCLEFARGIPAASFAVWRLFSFEGITHDGSKM